MAKELTAPAIVDGLDAKGNCEMSVLIFKLGGGTLDVPLPIDH